MAGAEVDDPSVESADAESADAYVDAEGRSRRVRPSSLEKQEQRANMFDKIRRVMDLSGQEEWLNAQGRRTLRDPLDDVAICPSSAIFRGCMEMYRVRSLEIDWINCLHLCILSSVLFANVSPIFFFFLLSFATVFRSPTHPMV